MEPVFIDVERDPQLIKVLFAQHNQPIPQYRLGDWVGIDLETHQPVVFQDLTPYAPLTLPHTPSGEPKET